MSRLTLDTSAYSAFKRNHVEVVQRTELVTLDRDFRHVPQILVALFEP